MNNEEFSKMMHDLVKESMQQQPLTPGATTPQNMTSSQIQPHNSSATLDTQGMRLSSSEPLQKHQEPQLHANKPTAIQKLMTIGTCLIVCLLLLPMLSFWFCSLFNSILEERRVGHIGYGVYRQYLSYIPGMLALQADNEVIYMTFRGGLPRNYNFSCLYLCSSGFYWK